MSLWHKRAGSNMRILDLEWNSLLLPVIESPATVPTTGVSATEVEVLPILPVLVQSKVISHVLNKDIFPLWSFLEFPLGFKFFLPAGAEFPVGNEIVVSSQDQLTAILHRKQAELCLLQTGGQNLPVELLRALPVLTVGLTPAPASTSSLAPTTGPGTAGVTVLQQKY